jgi:hypothetical protein
MKDKFTRIQLELPQDKVERLEALMKESGIKTKKELLNNALTFLEWAINERKDGKIIASVDEREKKLKELIMPLFASIE